MGKLMVCPKCNSPTVTTATRCVHCGYPVAERFSYLRTDEDIQRKFLQERSSVESAARYCEGKKNKNIKQKIYSYIYKFGIVAGIIFIATMVLLIFC